ncbi:MAG: hypothetical protein PHN58_05185, partial [Candidatus Cloacimonetes bacterium]|nr:hypothetical protein [Candidatus Cloacimonadota bacterium]
CPKTLFFVHLLTLVNWAYLSNKQLEKVKIAELCIRERKNKGKDRFIRLGKVMEYLYKDRVLTTEISFQHTYNSFGSEDSL